MVFKQKRKNMPVKTVLQVMGIALIVLLSFSCKKAIEQKERNIIIDAMTNGRWFVEQYTENTIDVTGDFFGYEFQFYENGRVDGIIGTITQSGTWNADISSYTITGIFPASAADPLKRLNYTWKITDSYLNYVVATTNTTNEANILHLRKK